MEDKTFLILRSFLHNKTYYIPEFAKNKSAFSKTTVNESEFENKEILEKLQESFHLIHLDLPKIEEKTFESIRGIAGKVVEQAKKIQDSILKYAKEKESLKKFSEASELKNAAKFLYQKIMVYNNEIMAQIPKTEKKSKPKKKAKKKKEK